MFKLRLQHPKKGCCYRLPTHRRGAHRKDFNDPFLFGNRIFSKRPLSMTGGLEGLKVI